MHDPQRARYPYAVMTEVLLQLLRVKQADDEDLNDYKKHFKEAKNNAISFLGNNFLDNFIENLPEYCWRMKSYF